jgi:hypothetical protein
MGAKDAKAWKNPPIDLPTNIAAQPSGATFSEPVGISISISEPSLFRILEKAPAKPVLASDELTEIPEPW